MTRAKDSPKEQLKSQPADAAVDSVEEASQESFPASDPPAWTVSTGEKGSDGDRDSDASKGSSNAKADTSGCVVSFLMEERGEIGGICGDLRPDPKEEYVQPDNEKETGGEG